jgi:hypothetical protein
LQTVAAPLVKLGLGGDVDLVLIGLDRHRLDRVGERHGEEHDGSGDGTSKPGNTPVLPPGRRRFTSC